MSIPSEYEAFAAEHPPGSGVHLLLIAKNSVGFQVRVAGTELTGTVGGFELALDSDDQDLAEKYAEPGEQLRGFVLHVEPEHQTIAFTLIDPSTDPWQAHAHELVAYAALPAKVVERHVRGYDVELFEGVIGLLPKDEVGWDGGEVLSEGQSVEVVVTRAPGRGHFMTVSARRAQVRPGGFNDEAVDDWERALPAEATVDDERQFRRKLAVDLASAGLSMAGACEESAPRETLLMLRDDASTALRLVAIAHEGLDEPARRALDMGSVTFSHPADLDPGERAAVARALAIADALDSFQWPISAWVADDGDGPSAEELADLAERAPFRELYSDGGGSTEGCVDGRIVAVTEIRRVAY